LIGYLFTTIAWSLGQYYLFRPGHPLLKAFTSCRASLVMVWEKSPKGIVIGIGLDTILVKPQTLDWSKRLDNWLKTA